MRVILIIFFTMLLSIDIIAKDKGFDVVPKEQITEQRVALVIGNNDYHRPLTRLNNTINDAQSIRDILSQRGFDVIYKENVSHRTFDSALEKFYQKLSYGGVGLLYFSGHGMEVDGENYLIPTDAKMGAKSDSKYEAIALNKIINRVQKIGNRLNIIILDACRNDPFAKAYGVGGLAKVEPPIGLFVSYATGAGKVSSDGRVGGNGLFTQYLIENMKKPLSLTEVFRKTRASVYDASGGKQFPAVYDQIIKGDFYFTLPTQKIVQPIIEPITISEEPKIIPTTEPKPIYNNHNFKYVFYGHRLSNNIWRSKYFKILNRHYTIPRVGDILESLASINIREYYIQNTQSGWKNAKVIGKISKGKRIKVIEVKEVYPNYFWIKFL